MEPEIRVDCMLWDASAETREEAIDMLAERMEKEGIVSHAEPLLTEVYREEQDHAHLFPPLALAHGSTSGLERPVFAMARLNRPIIWQGTPGIRYVGLMVHPSLQKEEAEAWCDSFGQRFNERKEGLDRVQSPREAAKLLQ